MINAFNQHNERKYSPVWLSCIDKSMNSWLNNFCPGFMVCPQKTWPFGNKYHSIADSNKNGHNHIMWCVQLVKGKDCLKLANSQWAFPTT